MTRVNFVFGKRKVEPKEGDFVFCTKPDGDFKKFIFAIITGVDGTKVGVNGLIVNPVGLKNKVEQKKAGVRSVEILTNPTPENCIFSLIYRVEYDNIAEVFDTKDGNVTPIPPKVYEVLDGWVRESLPELINKVLSLEPGDDRDVAKRTLQHKMDTLTNKALKRNLYSVCRSLKILF